MTSSACSSGRQACLAQVLMTRSSEAVKGFKNFQAPMVMPSTPFEVATHWHQCILGSVKHTPCLMNVLFSQVFVWMPRQQSFVEITQKANYPLARLQDSATYDPLGIVPMSTTQYLIVLVRAR